MPSNARRVPALCAQTEELPYKYVTVEGPVVAVESVAAHPARPLIAAGYENDMVIIAQLGKRDEMVIKTEGQGAVTKIAWSGDGSRLPESIRVGSAIAVMRDSFRRTSSA